MKQLFYIILFLSCEPKENNCNKDLTRRSIQFLNNSGYISFFLDTLFNDNYFQIASNCEFFDWEHIVRNSNFPKIKHGFLNSGYSDTIFYLTIRYPHNIYRLNTLADLNLSRQHTDSLLGPNRSKQNYIKKYGRHEYVVSKYFGDIDSNQISYGSFSATNDISIILESNMHTYYQLESLFTKILNSVSYKFNIRKLDFRLDSLDLDTLILRVNEINKFGIH